MKEKKVDIKYLPLLKKANLLEYQVLDMVEGGSTILEDNMKEVRGWMEILERECRRLEEEEKEDAPL